MGEWLASKPHGKGIYYYRNLDRYEGEWVDGQKHGRGEISVNYFCCSSNLTPCEVFVVPQTSTTTHTLNYIFTLLRTHSLPLPPSLHLSLSLSHITHTWTHDNSGTLFLANGDKYESDWRNGTQHLQY